MMEVLKKTLFVYKVQTFNSMWRRYSFDNTSLSDEIRDELFMIKGSSGDQETCIAVLSKVIDFKENGVAKSEDDETKEDTEVQSQLRFQVTCHSLSLLLQFSEKFQKPKVKPPNTRLF